MAEVAPGKKRINVTIDEEVLGWIDKNVEAKRFASRSHGFNYSAETLKRLSDGVGVDKRWWELAQLNERGELCDPLIGTPEDTAQLLFPQYAPVSEAEELEGWARTEGFERDNGYLLAYVYLRTVGRVEVEMATDASQKIVRIRYRPAHDIRQYEPIGLEFWHNLENSRWPGSRLLPVDRSNLVFNLKDLGDKAARLAVSLNAFSATEKKAEAVGSV